MTIIPQQLFHGTNQKFDEFNLSFIGSTTDDGMYGSGIYFTESLEEARKYGDHIICVSLKLQNPFIVGRGESLQGVMRNAGMLRSPEFGVNILGQATCTSTQATQILKDAGYDGVIKLDHYNNEYVAFHSDQVDIISTVKSRKLKPR